MNDCAAALRGSGRFHADVVYVLNELIAVRPRQSRIWRFLRNMFTVSSTTIPDIQLIVIAISVLFRFRSLRGVCTRDS